MKRTMSPRTALERLIQQLKETANWVVTLEKRPGKKYGALVVKRPGKEAVEFTARSAAENLDILRVLACQSAQTGGAGWTREQYEQRTKLETRTDRTLRRVRAARGR